MFCHFIEKVIETKIHDREEGQGKPAYGGTRQSYEKYPIS
jgi:hypothetical protein